jgi:thioredoxin reductase (NADPH)
MTDRPRYEVAVVGGGPAGTTAALYTTRLGHRTAVFEVEGGRHAAVSHVHNVYGVSEDVSGRELSDHAVEQFREYGGDYYLEAVDSVEGDDADGFVLRSDHTTAEAERVVLATGFSDVAPSVPGLQRFTGRGLHYCLHCDAYSLGDGPVYVLGHDDHAAEVAMVLLNVTADVDLLLDGREPAWSDETLRQLRAHPVDRVDDPVVGAFERAGGGDVDEEPWLGGLTFEDGAKQEYLGGFAMYGREYASGLAESLGCALADDGAIDVDGDQETSVDGVYAVGDVTHGQNQTTVAIGDGARAGIALHKELRTFPVAAADLDGDELADGVDAPAAPAALRARMRGDRDRDVHAGLRSPRPDR